MPSVEQCRAYAAEYALLGAHPRNSGSRSAVLTNISRSWTRWPPSKMDFSLSPSLAGSFLKTTLKLALMRRLIEAHRETR